MSVPAETHRGKDCAPQINGPADARSLSLESRIIFARARSIAGVFARVFAIPFVLPVARFTPRDVLLLDKTRVSR